MSLINGDFLFAGMSNQQLGLEVVTLDTPDIESSFGVASTVIFNEENKFISSHTETFEFKLTFKLRSCQAK